MVVQGKDPWGNTELFGDKRHHDLRRGLKVSRHKTKIPECAQLEGIPQTVEGFARAVDCACIVIREEKVHREIVLRTRLGKAPSALPLGGAEKADRE